MSIRDSMGRLASLLTNVVHAPGRISMIFDAVLRADANLGRHDGTEREPPQASNGKDPSFRPAKALFDPSAVTATTDLRAAVGSVEGEQRANAEVSETKSGGLPFAAERSRDGPRTRPMAPLSGDASKGVLSAQAQNLRVLHAPTNIGNQPWVLSRNERVLGVESDVVVHWTPPSFRFPADKVLGTVGGASDEEVLARMDAGLRAPLEYDVLHYYFGRSLFSWDDYNAGSPFPFLDVKLAKALRRPVFFTLQGCDVRLAHRSAARNEVTMCREGACRFFSNCISDLDARRQDFISNVLPLADKVFYLNPELGHYVEGAEFLPYSNVEIGDFEVIAPSQHGRIRIVHAPSDGAIKGTAGILDALESLKARYDFDLILVEGLPHEEAMRLYRNADIVIDQVLAGWYGGFAVEVMAMGKPVLCYLREEDFGNVPAEMIADLPIRNVRPESLVDDIADVLDRRAEWSAWSANSRRFVEKWHNPATIAAAMVAAYKEPTKSFDLVGGCNVQH